MSHQQGYASAEAELIELARAGDERAFAELVEPHRATLHAHCYRMLGSPADADDALQDALLGAWRGLRRFERRSSVRTWLYSIATNSCLRLLEGRARRKLATDRARAAHVGMPPGGPLPESEWLEPLADAALAVDHATPAVRYEQRERVELAFVAALQHLPPRQRAVLLLREVLDYSAGETAALLETTVPSVNSALQRARKTTAGRIPEQSQQATLEALGDAAARELVERYSDALERADIPGLLALLTEDAIWEMPPLTSWYQGRAALTAFLEEWPGKEYWRHIPTRANGQLAVGCYIWDESRGDYPAHTIDVLTLRGDRIAEVTAFINGSLFQHFGLPDALPALPGDRDRVSPRAAARPTP
jgi:RNA polymerase sigma-70 factor (ECF subfamily)